MIGQSLNVIGQCIGVGHCLPYPYDSELERLRRLERWAQIEEEKRRIRERLWQRGINPDAPVIPLVPMPVLPPPDWQVIGAPVVVCQPAVRKAPSLRDILGKAGKSSGH